MFGIWPHCIIHMATTLVQGWEPSSPNCTHAIAFWQVSLLLFMPSPPMPPAPTGIFNQAARVMLWKHWSYHITTLFHMSYLHSSPQRRVGRGGRGKPRIIAEYAPHLPDLIPCSPHSLYSSHKLPPRDLCTCCFLCLEDSSWYWHPSSLLLNGSFPVNSTLILFRIVPSPHLPRHFPTWFCHYSAQ